MRQRLLHYEIVREIGRGGMGVVFEGRDTHLDRRVAIKVLPAERVADADRKRRFIQEAKAASALNHSNIVTIHDVNCDDGSDFMVMEYIDGKTLDSVIRAKGLRPRQLVKYAVQVADAMAKAHAAGILHRDLKPSNIMVTGEDHVKILDFGLAKLTQPRETSENDTTLTQRPLTEEGWVMGTAAYMSPEQAEGRTLDGRSDIFSFGTVLYEALCGRRPFESDSRVTLLAKIINDDPSRLPESTPAPLGKVILRCLRKDPARRFLTMADLKVALEDVGDELASSGTQAMAAQPRRPWRAVAAMVAAVVLVAGYFACRSLRAPESAAPMTPAPLTTLPGIEAFPTFSPEGNQEAFQWTGSRAGASGIYVQMIGSGSALQVTKTLRTSSPAWSPDGRWIAFLQDLTGFKFELRLVPPLGGQERKLAEAELRTARSSSGVAVLGGLEHTPRPAWSPDSRFLVITDHTGEKTPDALFAVSIETREKQQLTYPELPAQGDVLPAVSPNGRFLVFQRILGVNAAELHLLPLRDGMSASGPPRRIASVAVSGLAPAWTPSSDEIVFSAQGGLWRMGITGAQAPVRLPFGEDGFMPAVSIPQPGKPSRLAYVRSISDSNIYKVETPAVGAPASAQPSVAIASTRTDRGPRFSPDGRRVAFTSDRSGWQEIWISDPDGSGAAQLTFLKAPNAAVPTWTPDGQTIAFESNAEGQNEIYSMSSGGGKPRRLTTHPANDSVPSFSRDGKWIYFRSNRGGESQVWKVPAAGGEPQLVTSNNGYVALESIDGAWLYYMQGGSLGPLWRIPVSGGPAEKILDSIHYRGFDVVEQGIYYLDSAPSGGTRLQFFRFDSQKSTNVTQIERGRQIWMGLSASPDGRTILFTRTDSSIRDLMLVENFR